MKISKKLLSLALAGCAVFGLALFQISPVEAFGGQARMKECYSHAGGGPYATVGMFQSCPLPPPHRVIVSGKFEQLHEPSGPECIIIKFTNDGDPTP